MSLVKTALIHKLATGQGVLDHLNDAAHAVARAQPAVSAAGKETIEAAKSAGKGVMQAGRNFYNTKYGPSVLGGAALVGGTLAAPHVYRGYKNIRAGHRRHQAMKQQQYQQAQAALGQYERPYG